MNKTTANKKVDVALLLEMRKSGTTQGECAKKFGVNVRVIRRLLDANNAPRSVVVAMTDKCPVCGKQYKKDRSSRVTCSMLCASKMRSNPLADEAKVTEMYLSGMSQQEIADSIGASQKSVMRALRRAGVESRQRIKRDQRGEKNHMWKGDAVGYKTAHNRVRSYRGDPMTCTHCGATNETARLEWANVTGNHPDPNDYISLCVPCHRRWDAERRKKSA